MSIYRVSKSASFAKGAGGCPRSSQKRKCCTDTPKTSTSARLAVTVRKPKTWGVGKDNDTSDVFFEKGAEGNVHRRSFCQGALPRPVIACPVPDRPHRAHRPARLIQRSALTAAAKFGRRAVNPCEKSTCGAPTYRWDENAFYAPAWWGVELSSRLRARPRPCVARLQSAAPKIHVTNRDSAASPQVAARKALQPQNRRTGHLGDFAKIIL